MELLPRAARKALASSDWVRLANPRGKLQISIQIAPTDLIDPAKHLSCQVQFSTNGVTADLESHGFTWNGRAQPKAPRPGWPTDGPAVRIASWKPVRADKSGNLLSDYWMDGLYVRVEVEGDAEYSVSLDEVPIGLRAEKRAT